MVGRGGRPEGVGGGSGASVGASSVTCAAASDATARATQTVITSPVSLHWVCGQPCLIAAVTGSRLKYIPLSTHDNGCDDNFYKGG